MSGPVLRWTCVGLPLLTLLLTMASPAITPEPGDALSAQSPEVKAALFFNIPSFVSWPENSRLPSDRPFTLCAAQQPGTEAFGGALQQIVRERNLQGRQVVFRTVQALQDLPGCQMLYTPELNTLAPAAEVRRAAADLHILTVGENPGFLHAGGMIRLHVREGHLAFSVNLKEARAAALLISARLLRLADTVLQGDGGQEAG